MNIKELSIEQFTKFVNASPLGTHYQSLNYALLMSEYGYEYELVGMFNEYNQLKAASLILFRKISGRYKYGYAPKGFILDYFNKEIVKEFSNALVDHYKKKHVVFIKLNPEIAISELDKDSGIPTYNWNYEIKDILKDSGFMKLKDNLYFESALPRFSAVINLKNYDITKVSKNTRNKINRAKQKGLHIEDAERSGMDILDSFTPSDHDNEPFYFKDLFNVYKKNDMVDLFLVSIDKEEYLIDAKRLFEEEEIRNNKLSQTLTVSNMQKDINKKMDSDRKLVYYANDVREATEMNKNHSKVYVAGALVIKYHNRIQIILSGYNRKYKHFNPNYFLHHEILEYYKDKYEYAELGGITGDFTMANPYRGLNKFKLGFNPKVYEYIGEYDLPINEKLYIKYRSNGTLARLLNKKNIKRK